MASNDERDFSMWSLMRLATPVLITVCLFVISSMNSTMTRIDEKLFKHLTNDEIHSPKSMVVSKAEFSIYQGFREREMNELRLSQNEMQKNQKEILDAIKNIRR